jgi:hypothetical protein
VVLPAAAAGVVVAVVVVVAEGEELHLWLISVKLRRQSWPTTR